MGSSHPDTDVQQPVGVIPGRNHLAFDMTHTGSHVSTTAQGVSGGYEENKPRTKSNYIGWMVREN